MTMEEEKAIQDDNECFMNEFINDPNVRELVLAVCLCLFIAILVGLALGAMLLL